MSTVLLIVAIVLFLVYGVVGFFSAFEGRVANLLLGLGLAALAASFLAPLQP